MDLRGTTALSGSVKPAAGSTAAVAGGVVVNAIPGMSAKTVADYAATNLKLAAMGQVSALPSPVPTGL
jgi:hypothetical protein